MEKKSDAQPPGESTVEHADPAGAPRRGRLRLVALLAALAIAVAAFGALVLPRAATDASLASEEAGTTGYAVIVDYESRVLDRGGCERDDVYVTGDPTQQT